MSTIQHRPAADVRLLRADGFEGELIGPQAHEYDQARRVWNGIIDRRPRVIARPATVDDVSRAVRFARAHDMLVAIKGGGHNVAGLATAEDALVVDLERFREVHVDTVHRRATAGGGARLADVDAVTQRHGLAVPLGLVSATGIGGLALSGGIGWLRNAHGLTCDNLTEADVVVADGRVVTANLRRNPELLWGLRGGGGNFGVVTRFEFTAHPLGPEVALALVFYDARELTSVLRAFRVLVADLPHEVSALAFAGTVPQGMVGLPADVWGHPMVAVAGVYAGAVERGTAVLRGLRQLGAPIGDLSGVYLFNQVQRLLDADYPDGLRYYWKSAPLDGLADEVIDLIAERASQAPSSLNTIDVWHMGGAAREEPLGGAAYNGRRAHFIIAPEGNWTDARHDAANMAWVRGIVRDVQAHSAGGAYLNFPGFLEEGEELLRTSYGDKYERLATVKRTWDPDNVFRVNHNIRPAVQGVAAGR